MNKEQFLINFTEQFDETDSSLIKLESKFRDLDEWSSMMALIVIAMVDQEYNVKLTGDDIRTSETVSDLYDKISEK
ncbi:acyl carrier protein [Flavobacterium sp. F-380]|jgi:acyl carrier protein|uniref:Acyl carrier protein n=1 Tax=Flavobacterium kayseriense TaxID=2764714 RepID=A0ABR7J7Q7_9FLAO|nr:phosphopantetheine-binding protein [Flavobacterium kayseriense]MBC5841487.1 acyl carrier protein [Flavobacterium kayseriense]MBC5848015.1 acyl carrier protein [Flavobacterium kayseriense]